MLFRSHSAGHVSNPDPGKRGRQAPGGGLRAIRAENSGVPRWQCPNVMLVYIGNQSSKKIKTVSVTGIEYAKGTVDEVRR